MSSVPGLPPEIISLILELAVLTSPPSSSSRTGGTSSQADWVSASPFASALPASRRSDWSHLASLLYVSRLFHALSRPLLLRTLALNSARAGRSFFGNIVAVHGSSTDESRSKCIDLAYVRRAWLGNITALKRNEIDLDPLCLKLDEAGWFEECSGGFVVGHTYASRPRIPRRCKSKAESKETSETGPKGAKKQFQRVSVYWAEEELIEEVRNPSDLDDEDDDLSSDEHGDGFGANHALPDPSVHGMVHRQGTGTNAPLTGDPRIDRPHEPAWQTLYRRNGAAFLRNTNARLEPSNRSSPNSRLSQSGRQNIGPSTSAGHNLAAGWVGIHGPPAEGEIDPWEMWEAQERLASLPTPSSISPSLDTVPVEEPAQTLSQALDAHLHDQQRRLRGTEIYAYHLCTATLEPWINALFSSIRTLRYITLTFTPGHILDDDKLEHMLRRILTRAENPRLEVLLIRMVFEPSVAGSRMRRFERAKTIGGAVDRIADERVRVMLVAGVVGQGNLVQSSPESPSQPLGSTSKQSTSTSVIEEVDDFLSPLSRRAVAITQEAWWSRILQQNRFYAPPALPHPLSGSEQVEQGSRLSVSDPSVHDGPNRVQPWTSFFGYESGRAEWMGKTIGHCNPWPDDPIPLEHPNYHTRSKTTQLHTPSAQTQHRQLDYVNGWAARDRDNTNAPIEE